MAQNNTSFVTWDWASQHVQVELVNGEYVTSEATLILAGPSKLSYVQDVNQNALKARSALYPVGLLQMLQMAQNRQVARLFEVGSKRAYFVPGRMFANFQINRILFYGPSLLRMLYAVAPSRVGANPFKFVGENGIPLPKDTLETPAKYDGLFPTSVRLKPGFGAGRAGADNRDFWINVASEVFNIPFGLCMVLKDAKNRSYGAFYLEDCMLEAHSFGVDANNVVLAEGVTGQFDMVNPIQVEETPAVRA